MGVGGVGEDGLWFVWRERKLIVWGGHGSPEKWYNIRHRYGGKETRKQQDEVFGCIPHGRGAYVK